MAGTIRGITIEIGGNTQPLNKSLEGVNKKTRDLQSELKQVERLLKLDPGNTELLAQQQRLLADAISNSSDRLDVLRAAQQQVNDQFARGQIGEDQYRAFQREVIQAEQELARFENRLGETQQASNNLGENLQATGDKMKSAGEKMSVGLTAPIVAAGGIMLKGAVDAEAAQGKLQAQLGITAAEADKLGETAKEVWKTGFGENIDAASEAVKNVRLNMGDLADNELQAVATGALAISELFEADVKESTAAAGVMMKSFGVSGQEALDLITTGFQKGGDYSGELIDTLREYSPQFAAMGMSADQMLGILIAGTKAGAWNMDKVGDAMKEFNIRAQDGSKTTAEGFAAIGLEAQKMGADIAAGGEKGKQAFTATITALAAMKDPVAQNTAGVALFGTQWEDVKAKVIIAMAEGVKGVGDFKGATDKATADLKNNNPGMALTAAMRELQAAIGPALLPIADIIKNTIVPAIKSLADGFNNLSPGGQKAVLAIAGIAAAIGPLLMIIGPIVSAIGAMAVAAAGGATGIGILTTAFPALGAAIAALSGPVGWAIAGVAALTVGGITLYKHLQNDAVPAVQLFGDETSKATEKAVGAYMDLDEKAGQSLLNLKLTGETVTKEMADSLTGNFAQMTDSLTAGMEKDFQESLSNMQDYLAASNALRTEEESQILANMQTGYEQRKQAVADGEAQIKEILATASQEKRALTQTELTEIGNIQQQMKTQAVQILSDTELESKAILERMRQQADELTTQQAADVVKNSTEQKDKAVKAAEEQYNDVIKEIIRQRDEAGTISKDQADKLIADATRQKDETIKKAEEMHAGVIKEAQAQAGEHVKQIDWETGEIKTKWQVLREDLGLEGNNIYLGMVGPAGWVVLSAKRTVEQFTQMKNDAVAKFGELKKDALAKMEELKPGLDGTIERIKTAFANMRITIPTPRLPQIKWTWKEISVKGASINIPDLYWAAKGGIFDSPSIIGVGEAGKEAVIPLDKLPGMIASALREAIGGNQVALAGGGDIIIQQMIVRNDQDISRIARELYNLQQTNARGRGMR